MSDDIESYVQALVVSSGAPLLRDFRKGILDKIGREGLLETVFTRYLDHVNSPHMPSPTLETLSHGPSQLSTGTTAADIGPVPAVIEVHNGVASRKIKISANVKQS